ncbi:MAG: hypothetical protein SFV15_13385 [Polyangiaceae bacterium]|nr:hypothetical protein [Polyangiaceae bacterium]
MSEPHGSATAGVFGATFTGDSTLVLQVGEQSSGTSTVTLESFSLNSASLESLVSPLNAKPRGAQLPIVVSPGPATKVVFDLGPTELSEAQRTRICGESVLYVASISDSLSGGQVSQVQGPAFTVSCLP